MKVSLFYLPSIGSRQEIERGMAGVREDLYQRMLQELVEQAQLADALGYESISFTEHHFHIEGFEVSTNPVLLDLYIALHTRRIRVGQLGIVLPAHNPLQVAEDLAMVDHMTGGRLNVGFARGYQRRWVDTMAQLYHGIHGVRPGQHDEVDQANWEVFQECYEIIKLAWTQETFSYQGKYWKIPPDEVPWDIEATRRWGTGVSEDGVLRQVGIVPRPLQKPHPPVFQPFASSETTIRWCAREGITAILPPMFLATQNYLYQVYREEAASHGRYLAEGEGLGVLRDVVVADTDEEALRLWHEGPAFVGAAWFRPFGFDFLMRDPGRVSSLAPQEMMDRSLILVGSPESVCFQLERLLKQTPVSWLFAWVYNGVIPHVKLMRSLELFATKVLPRFQ